jgi:uncharacterized protein YciI
MADVPRNLKPYFLCLFRKGPHWDIPKDHEDLMPAQLAFLRHQTEAGNFLLAGPVLGHMQDPTDDVTGIAIIHASNFKEAQTLANEDPAVQAGRLIAEVRPVFLPALDAIRVQY